MNIFLRELRANRKALVIWCVCMFAFVAGGMSKFTAYAAGGDSNNVIQQLPQSLKALLGMGALDVTRMSGFFGFLFLYFEVALGVHAVLLGSGILSKEERDKTTEFLLTRPVSRSVIVTAKFLASLFNVVVLNLFTLASCLVLVPMYNNGPDITSEILTFFASLFIVQLIFLSLGALIAAAMRNSKAAGSLSAGILVGMYVIAEITSLTDRLNALNVLSPFKYFDYVRIADGNGLDALIVVLSIVLIAVFSASTYYCYNRRNMNI